jgi:YYY domain-containing protein
MNTFISIILWCLCLELLAIGAVPLLRLALPHFPDLGVGLAKTTGILLFGGIIWLLNEAGLIESSKLTVRLLAIVFIYGGIFWTYYKKQLSFSIRAFFANRALFYFIFILFLLLRSLQPEIFWGEKTMDFTFVNFFIRLDRLPPEDPWAAGHPMSYYYLGTYFFALLHKLSGVASPIGYNLAIATLPALLAANIYSLLLAITRHRFFSLFGTLAATLFGNIEVLRLVLSKERPIGFDLSWASTRLFTSPGFNEYPIWSFSFADLHAHVIAYPFASLVLALCFGTIPDNNKEESPPHSMLALFILLGIALGALVGINMWDALILCPIVGLVFLRYQLSGLANIRNVLVCGASAAIFAIPFIASTLNRPNEVGWGYVTPPEFNHPLSIFLMFGLFFLPMAVVAIRALFSTPALAKTSALAVSSTALLILALIFSHRQIAPLPFDSLTLFFIVLYISCSAAFIRELQYPFFLATVCSLILIGAEFFYLLDRMNTIFKFYTATWVPFCIATTCGLWYLWINTKGLISRYIIGVFIAVWAIIGFTSGAICAYGLSTIHHTKGPQYTLNGTAYRDFMDHDEALLIDWINQNVKGTPTILESYDIPYGPYTRISMNTGLPTVMGWEHHIGQRGVEQADVRNRKESVKEIYTTSSLKRALTLLKIYNVNIIVVGNLEHELYGPAAGDIFKNNAEQFQVLFTSGNTSLYLVK